MRNLLLSPINRQAAEVRPTVRIPDATQRLRGARRSSSYIQALGRLDGCESSELDLSDLAGVIGEEFGIGETAPLGCVARCYLGHPFEVHTVDLVGRIVEHYHASQPLPGPLERARHLAVHPAYLAIEVYVDRLVCVRADGATAEINQ